MRYRFLRRRAAIVTPRMTIRRHVPWPVRVGLVVLALVAAFGGGVFFGRAAPSGVVGAGPAELARLRADNDALRAERDRAAAPQGIDSQAVMDRSTLVSLADQIKRLEADNARLRDDVSFFEGATADRQGRAASKGTVSIARFQVTQDRAAQLARYRLLVTQDSRAAQVFAGDLQLAVTVRRAGKAVTIVLPSNPGATPPADTVQVEGDPAQFRIVFRSYRRIDGSFRFAPDATLVSVQARLVDRGTVVAQQTVVVE